jgi:hypothetical protein
MHNLILVAGHAIPYRFDRLEHDDGWFLKNFQAGEGALYLDHIRRGVELAALDPVALLLFAGGQTDRAAGPRSEAQGYWLAADHLNWFGFPEVRERATTEEFSLDSFENLLFGLCRFREVAGSYPEGVVAVGWGFKGPRFELHRQALHFPAERFRYEAVNDPPELVASQKFEAERRSIFLQDPYGAGPEPSAKRAARNAFQRQHGYRTSCPEVAGLLEHCGPELYAGPLPWTTASPARTAADTGAPS